ncbi:DUF3558 domain-containing protein [Nocardia sp. NPDC050435]|uniref:DUF3558 domain-containing protein n=1 Tax=Nocardia sp. NPDC050435 TaxID=3155040 RepID=UPI0033E623F2
MRAVAGAVLLVGALAVAGCDSNGGGQAPPSTSTTPAVAADVPQGFKPCNDIPQSVLDSEGIRKDKYGDDTSRGEIKWRGCGYLMSDGYAASISATNLTLDMVKAKRFPGERSITINGRTVLITAQAPDPTGDESCQLHAQMQGGSLEFTIDNPNSRRKTGHLNACDIGQTLAGKVVPLIPAGA